MKRRVWTAFLLPFGIVASVVGVGYSAWYFADGYSTLGVGVEVTYLSTVNNYEILYQGQRTQLIFDQTEEGRTAAGGNVTGAGPARGIHFHVDESEGDGIHVTVQTRDRSEWADVPVALSYEMTLTGLDGLASLSYPSGYFDNQGNTWHQMGESAGRIDWDSAETIEKENEETGLMETWYRVEVPFTAETCGLSYVDEPSDDSEYDAFQSALSSSRCSLSFTLVELH